MLLASASDAIIIGFNVKVENKALAVAKREGVQVKLYSIIYELIDQVKEAMAGLLDPITREKVIGHARVKQVFKVNKGFVGGSVVTDGVMNRKQRARVLRDGQAVYDGGFETLRRFRTKSPKSATASSAASSSTASPTTKKATSSSATNSRRSPKRSSSRRLSSAGFAVKAPFDGSKNHRCLL